MTEDMESVGVVREVRRGRRRRSMISVWSVTGELTGEVRLCEE